MVILVKLIFNETYFKSWNFLNYSDMNLNTKSVFQNIIVPQEGDHQAANDHLQ